MTVATKNQVNGLWTDHQIGNQSLVEIDNKYHPRFPHQNHDLQVSWNSTTIMEMITVPLRLESSLHFNKIGQRSKLLYNNTRHPLRSLSHIQGHHCLAHSKLSDLAMSIMVVLLICLLVTNSSSYIWLQQIQTIMQRTTTNQGAWR